MPTFDTLALARTDPTVAAAFAALAHADIRTRQRKPRPARWAAALAELRTLQGEYETWRDGLPEDMAESQTAELLEGVCDVDLDALDLELPRSFGRD